MARAGRLFFREMRQFESLTPFFCFLLLRKSGAGKATHAVSTGTGTHTYTDEEKYVNFARATLSGLLTHRICAKAVGDKHTLLLARLLLASGVCVSHSISSNTSYFFIGSPLLIGSMMPSARMLI